MTEQENELLSKLVDKYGAYEVTKVLVDIVTFASEDYHSQGNHGAIIHKDAESLSNVLFRMKNSHPLRMLKGG